MATRDRTIVLVHGAWHGAWCWQRVVPFIEQHGIGVRAIDLPSTRIGVSPNANLSGDAAAVRELIETIPGPVVVCGHSYGGMVISHEAVGTHPRVAHLAYVCAFMPDNGQSLVSIGDGRPAPWIRLNERGLTLPDMELASELFYADCDPGTQQWALGQLHEQPPAPYVEPVGTPSWRSVPSTYIVCTQDRIMPPDLQRNVFAPRARLMRELDASHSPFLSQPEALARLLVECCKA